MASFTDEIPQFTPYIQQNPVEAMVAVGVQRETQFNEGIKKVQSYYDNLLSLPIGKAETQEYVKSKVNQLNQAVSSSVQGDFSDQRLINQIGGLAGKIANDPIVQNGVASTAAIQSGYAKIQEAQKAGKSAPQNEEFFQNMVNAWQTDGDIESTFSGNYTPHVDYIDKFMKLYKEMHPGEDINQDAFRIDGGEIKINPTLIKGVSADKIASVWQLINSQPDVRNQLNIDGWYNYRGATPQALYKSLEDDTKSYMKNAEDAIRTMQTKIATDGTANVAQLSADIQSLKNQVEGRKSRFTNATALLTSNPDAYKAQLVNESVGSSLMNAYAYGTMEKSPLWETSFQQSKWNEEIRQWGLHSTKMKESLDGSNRKI